MTSTAPACAEQAHRKQGVPAGLALKSKAHLTWVRPFRFPQTLPQFSVLLTGRHGSKWRVFSLPVCGPNIFKLCVKISLKNYRTIHWLDAAKKQRWRNTTGNGREPRLGTIREHVPPLGATALSNGSTGFNFCTVHSTRSFLPAI